MLGKLAASIANVLVGKHKPRGIYDQSLDSGDYVVVTNARHVVVTGRKDEQKVYRHHTMYAGGLKEISFADMMKKKPDQVSIDGDYCWRIFLLCRSHESACTLAKIAADHFRYPIASAAGRA